MKLFALLLLGLGAVEGLAFWWMHPAPVGLCQPVLAYRPREVKAQTPKSETLKEEAAAQNFSSISASLPSSVSAFTFTPLPETYARSAPMLRCSGGQVFRVDLDDTLSLHLAFFEWDGTDTGSVLEAFRHMPEECMGSIGMTLIEKAPPRFYTVREQGTVGLDRRAGRDVASGAESETRDQESAIRGQEKAPAAAQDSAQSSSSNPKSTINNHQSSISPSSSSSSSSTSTFDVQRSMFDVPSPSSSSSPHSKSKIQNSTLATQSLLFDHTVFRDPGGVIVHAFKGTWVSGADLLIGGDLRGGVEQWRQIRWKAAFKRFRPAHARVAQGAIRGAPSADAAWQAFEQAMLKDLHFAR